MRTELFGIPVNILSSEETLAHIDSAISSRGRLQHVALNVAKLVSCQSNAELREDVITSDIVGIDGMGIVLALRLMGHARVERVSGVDLMMSTLELSAQKGYRPYFLGATPAVVGAAVEAARGRWPHLQFAGFQHGYFQPNDEAVIMERIRDSGADCLFIGMPTPRKERLLKAWRDQLDVPFIMGVGGGLDVLAGHVERAPTWMQANGLEWLYRIYQEPGRMWWRYLRTNTLFAVMLSQLMLQKLAGGALPARRS